MFTPPATKRKTLKPHQKTAVNAGVHAVRYGGRATIVSPCGTGKTLMAARICEELARTRRALRRLVLVPTLDLLVQILDDFRADSRNLGDVYAVCSRHPALDARGIPHTTDAATFVELLADSDHHTVFATYASLVEDEKQSGAIITAHNSAALPEWDLIICDEAHRTSGSLAKTWAVVHDNIQVPARRRLYFTATPRIWTTDRTYAEGLDLAGTGPEPELVASMLDEDIFGPTVFSMMLSQAVAEGLARDYRIVLVNVDHPTLQPALRRTRNATANDPLALLSLATALLKTCAHHHIQRMITFHRTIKDSDAFIAKLVETAHALTDTLTDTPDGPRPLCPPSLWARSVHQETPDRHDVLNAFRGNHLLAALMILANARLLGEGVDVPTVDGLCFAAPKGSVVDIVQALGRAVRLHPTSTDKATLLVPVYLAPGEDHKDLLQTDAFRPLYEVLSALRAHDLRIADRLPTTALTSPAPHKPAEAPGNKPSAPEAVDEPSAPLPPADSGRPPFGPAAGDIPEIIGTDGQRITAEELDRVMQLRVVNPTGVTEAWMDMAIEASRYHDRHGHLAVTPVQAAELDTNPHRVDLYTWLSNQRTAKRRGELTPFQIKFLDSHGMQWDPRKDNEDAFITYAEECARTEGGLAVTSGYKAPDGHHFGRLLANHRYRANDRKGNAYIIQELSRIDPYWNPGWDLTWQRYYQKAALRHTQDEPLTQRGDSSAYRRWLKDPQPRVPQQHTLLQQIGLPPDSA
ncbi:DEAD/DEAH box helicase [Streptomyces lydicus]|uniref:DEAD/DEAH box helicase n=1 Tax=Streptomyces lydicus TaxID=47763 RepID=UPI00101315DC|nr:DEAD/DEAH box helicase [Streptomyces lydicus]MCZ1011870.1 DEAD/DEAH box helicase family protein [Streptomyces lydicus]